MSIMSNEICINEEMLPKYTYTYIYIYIVKAMVCRIVVREFVLQSRYYIHFQANIFGKGMNPLILPAMG